MAETCQNMIFAFQDWSIDPFQKSCWISLSALRMYLVRQMIAVRSEKSLKFIRSGASESPSGFVEFRSCTRCQAACWGYSLVTFLMMSSAFGWPLLTFRPFLDQLLNFGSNWSDFRVKSSVHNSSCLVIEIPKPRNEAAASRTCSL